MPKTKPFAETENEKDMPKRPADSTVPATATEGEVNTLDTGHGNPPKKPPTEEQE